MSRLTPKILVFRARPCPRPNVTDFRLRVYLDFDIDGISHLSNSILTSSAVAAVLVVQPPYMPVLIVFYVFYCSAVRLCAASSHGLTTSC